MLVVWRGREAHKDGVVASGVEEGDVAVGGVGLGGGVGWRDRG